MSRIMKKYLLLFLVFMLALGMLPAMAEAVAVSGVVAAIDQYGAVQLDITNEAFQKAGFAPGDIVTVKAGSYTGDMPCFNGYYVDRGSCMLRINPYQAGITLCVNYGSFAELTGLSVGDPVTVTMKEKGGALQIQEINDLFYTDDRADYASDAVFANFRPVVAGKLYRSASPVDNKANRARYADDLIRKAGVQAVMNMANRPEDVAALIAAEDYDSPYYRELFEAGKVFSKKMAIDFASDDFAADVVRGFSFLAGQNTPYLVHCLEGKDRTGFAIMILEALMGWSEDRIEDDYMLTYTNYYGIEPGSDKYDMIAKKNIGEMLCTMAGLEAGASPAETDLKAAAEAYLLDHGMAEEVLKQLEDKLASE